MSVNREVVKRWSPPLVNRYKVNVDGAVFASQKAIRIGVVIRDAAGAAMGAYSKENSGAMEAEAKAFELGIQFAKDLMIYDFILEGDSLIMVNALMEQSPPPTSVAAIVYGSLDAVRGCRKVDFSHVGRNGNNPAHILAKYASDIANFSVWLEESPCCIEQALLHDVMSIP